MANELLCPICGKPTRVYMGNARKDGLCGEHADQLKRGEISLNEKGLYFDVATGCVLKPTQNKHYEELPVSGFDKCVLCGEETRGFAFCRSCYKKHSPGELLDILNGKKATEDAESENNVETASPDLHATIKIDHSSKMRCITCGRATDGVLFCPSCYGKYKGKELFFKITNCTSVELLDENYAGQFSCKDGHVVKSKSEVLIDNYLYDHGIIHAYEKPLPYGSGEDEYLKPDFFLPDYLGKGKHVYIEHWGLDGNNRDYQKSKAFKIKIYKDLGITLVCTYEKDMNNAEGSLDRKLNIKFMNEGEINE